MVLHLKLKRNIILCLLIYSRAYGTETTKIGSAPKTDEGAGQNIRSQLERILAKPKTGQAPQPTPQRPTTIPAPEKSKTSLPAHPPPTSIATGAITLGEPTTEDDPKVSTALSDEKLDKILENAKKESDKIRLNLAKRQAKKRKQKQALKITNVVINTSFTAFAQTASMLGTVISIAGKLDPDPHSRLPLQIVGNVIKSGSMFIKPAGFVVARLLIPYGRYLDKAPLLAGNEILVDQIVKLDLQIDNKTKELARLVNPQEIPTGDMPLYERIWESATALSRVVTRKTTDFLDKTYITDVKGQRWVKMVALRDELDALQTEKKKYERAIQLNIFTRTLYQLQMRLKPKQSREILLESQNAYDAALKNLITQAGKAKKKDLKNIQDQVKDLESRRLTVSMDLEELDKPLTPDKEAEILAEIEILQTEIRRHNKLNDRDVSSWLEELDERIRDLEEMQDNETTDEPQTRK